MGYQVDANGDRIVAISRHKLRKKTFQNVVDGGESMKVDGSAGTLDENVWDGETAFWADPTIGSKTAPAARSGSFGWDSGVTALNDKVKFTRSTPWQPTSDSIEGWINLQAMPPGAEIQARWELANTAKGNGVLVTDYIGSGDLGVWQHFSIPLADFNLPAENVDEFRIRTRQIAGAHYFLDDLTLNSGSGGKTFRVAPSGSKQWIVGSVTLVLVAPDTGWNSNAFANIAGGLANGLTLRHRDLAGSSNHWKLVCKQNTELFGNFDPVVDTAYNDSTRQISFVMKPDPASITLTANDVLEFLVKDDLTALTNLRAFAQIGVLVDT
jgi:hypothetical protein